MSEQQNPDSDPNIEPGGDTVEPEETGLPTAPDEVGAAESDDDTTNEEAPPITPSVTNG